ncbi:MAG: RHS repeat-associated core domain-containing protein, partial [Proteobacteria bacterium]|nr:RHS repeat-associated core domain-containing protein [Pseudomonadota bacterium]
PRLITDGSGNQVAYHVYYPFGEEATDPFQDQERMKFTGHERDLNNPDGTGDDLDYMHARFCSPLNGRFLSTDAIESADQRNPQSWNRYSYVQNNPLRFIDPLGLLEAMVYGEVWDVEPGDVVVLVSDDESALVTHVVIVGGFKEKAGSDVPDALIFENAPQEKEEIQDYEDAEAHQPTLINSNDISAGAGEWNLVTSNVGAIVENFNATENRPFTATETARSVSSVGPVRYFNLFAGNPGSTTDCAGFVNQVVKNLQQYGGRLSPYRDSLGNPKRISDWMEIGK